MSDFQFTISAEDIDADALKEIKKLEAEKSRLVQKLTADLRSHDRYKAAFDLMKVSSYDFRKIAPVVNWTGSGFRIEVSMDTPKSPTPASYKPASFVEPKIVNMLLNGKLLSDDEKRKLLASILPPEVLTENNA